MGVKNQEPCLRLLRPRLAERMRERGLTVYQIAEMCDMTRPAFSQYLNGKRIPATMHLVRIDRVLDCSTDWLLGLSDDPTPRR
jgi:predicted transcriptional regulator